MSRYTTGEMVEICNVSVRTIQFYDAKKGSIRTIKERIKKSKTISLNSIIDIEKIMNKKKKLKKLTL